MKNSLLLIAEDELSILDLLESALTEAGFAVVTAGNGSQALAELDVGASRLGAIITDINLGSGPDGWEVARRARELVPDIPVIYVSGASTYEWPSKGVLRSVFIGKPFMPTRVIKAVSALLAEPNTGRAALGCGQ